jgi:hypothetical protein
MDVCHAIKCQREKNDKNLEMADKKNVRLKKVSIKYRDFQVCIAIVFKSYFCTQCY